MILYSALCQQSLLFSNQEESDAFYDGNGFCTYFIHQFAKYFGSEDNIGKIFWLVDFAIIIPVATFFALDQPHDCFVCLGKDPDRNYSIHQLKRVEKARRKIQAKFGLS